MPTALIAGGPTRPDGWLMRVMADALPGWSVRPATLRRTARADALVIAGATTFATVRAPLPVLSRTAALVLAASARGLPIAFVGVGAGPLDGRIARALARTLVRAADLLVVTEEGSGELLARAGAPAPFRIGAELRWAVPAPPRRAATTATTATTAATTDAIVSTDPSELVAAALAGVPFVAIECEPRTAALARRLGQCGVAPWATEHAVAAAGARAAQEPPAAPAAVRREIEAARRSLTLLRLLLSEGTSEPAGAVTGLDLHPEPWAA